jgi:hypothetical protein
MLHEEADGIAAAPATEAFVYFLGRGNGEGRRFFVVKRAEAKIVGAALFQLHKPADDLRNVNTAEDLLYGLLGDQFAGIERSI